MAVSYNQGSTHINLTGVYQAVALGLYMYREHTQTKLCYGWQPIVKEELGQGETAMNGIKGAYQGAK